MQREVEKKYFQQYYYKINVKKIYLYNFSVWMTLLTFLYNLINQKCFQWPNWIKYILLAFKSLINRRSLISGFLFNENTFIAMVYYTFSFTSQRQKQNWCSTVKSLIDLRLPNTVHVYISSFVGHYFHLHTKWKFVRLEVI